MNDPVLSEPTLLARVLAWLLGLGDPSAVRDLSLRSVSAGGPVTLEAGWVDPSRGGPMWLILAIVAVTGITITIYVRYQRTQVAVAGQTRHHRRTVVPAVLATLRAAVMALLLVTLAIPVLHLTTVTRQRPLFEIYLDGTESMAIRDDLPSDERVRLRSMLLSESQIAASEASGTPASTTPAPGDNPPAATTSDESDEHDRSALETRTAIARAVVTGQRLDLVERLRARGADVAVHLFEGDATSHLRTIPLADRDGRPASEDEISAAITATGRVTSLSAALEDLAGRPGASRREGVLLISDFAHNAGPSPLDEGGRGGGAVARLGVPIHTLGLGSLETVDLAVDLLVDPRLKRTERSTLSVKIRQTGLTGQTARLTVTARPLSRMDDPGSLVGPETRILDTRDVTLAAASLSVDLPFTPETAGRTEFVAEVTPLPGETFTENNVARREVPVIDDYLRLLFAEYEPTWEWRFIKEVFHRDKLVGLDGFRTYLASSDPRVRESNPLFLPTATPRRSEFFSQDVIFLGDMPAGAITSRFADLVQEFVGTFGGGLVVISGPRFGPQALVGTPIEEMLPVVLDPTSNLAVSDRRFPLVKTAYASQYDFMTLGSTAEEDARGWANLAKLPWYQRVAQVHPAATVLAQHPTDLCRDGRTPQPLIAVRRYGAGEVVYLGFNETWRLRRLYGEQYYRQFWSQLIYRLGMSHALGGEKRFVVRTDRPSYRTGEDAFITVEAYDANFEPLRPETLDGPGLTLDLLRAGEDGTPLRQVTAVPVREGLFEARLPIQAAGNYLLRTTDPVTRRLSEIRFDVAESGAERRTLVRNIALQRAIADASGGEALEVSDLDGWLDRWQFSATEQTHERHFPLWRTPLWMILFVSLLTVEWITRKAVHLP